MKQRQQTRLRRMVGSDQESQKAPETAFPRLFVPEDPVLFSQQFFGFQVYPYQASLLRDRAKRIVVRWSRQAGKTTCIALRAIWFACAYPKTLTLIVAPTLRQSMIMSDRIQDFLAAMPKKNTPRSLRGCSAQRFVSETAAKSSPYPTAPSCFAATRQTKLYATKAHFSKTTNSSSTTSSTRCLAPPTAPS